MKLLHPEVEITPGRPGKRPQSAQYQEREKLEGSVILRLENDTTQNNAYTVRLRCEHPFWQEGWYTVQSLPPAPGTANTPSAPDVRGHGERSVKVFVPRTGTRDILIRFSVPARPECRAGRYDYTIEVETQVSDLQIASNGAARRKDRLTSLPAIANLRPFYKWSLDMTPEQRRVGRRHRTGEFEVVVTNESNDWLYCDLQLPRPKDLMLECPTLRLAVPPPEPGELLPAVGLNEGRAGTQRSVPLLATTRLKLFRGDLTPQPLSVSALRVDAPSLPTPSEDGYASLGSVVAVGTTEVQPAPADRVLMYAPPVPAKLVDFFARGAGSFRAWIAPLLLLLIAIPAAFIIIQHIWFAVKINSFGTVGTSSLAVAGKPLIISGKYVIGSHVLITTEPDGRGKMLYQQDANEVKDVVRTMGVDTAGGPKLDRCSIKIPLSLDHASAYLVVQRLGAVFPYLSAILPKDSKPIQIGDVLVNKNPEVTPVDPGPYAVHGNFTIEGQNLGSNGFVLVGGQRAVTTGWTPSLINVTIPQTLPASVNPLPVSVRLASTSLDAGSITIGSVPIPAPTPGGGSSGSSAAASGGSSGGGGGKTASGGGGKAAATGGAGKIVKNSSGATAPGNSHHPPPPFKPPIHLAPPTATLTAEDDLLRDQYSEAINAVSNQDTPYAHAIKAIAYAKEGKTDQATAEVGTADRSAATPADKALALEAHGWIAYQQRNFAVARSDFKQAVDDNPTPLTEVSNAWGQPDITNVTSKLHTMLSEPGLTPATKHDVNIQYQKAFQKEMQ